MTSASWTPDRDTPPRYARISGDFNPVHLDEGFAQKAGFPTVIVHGMCALGASARAAHGFAAPHSRLAAIDVRFANALLPGQKIGFAATTRDAPPGHRVSLDVRLDDGKALVNPAGFTFVGRAEPWPVPKDAVLEPDERDVVGEPLVLDAALLAEYDALTRPTEPVADEGVPPMATLLGLTGALERAFRSVEVPARPGTWVHLRQIGTFHAEAEPGGSVRCRVQAGRTVARTQAVGVHVTIPFLIETLSGTLVATGQCVLLYAFQEAP